MGAEKKRIRHPRSTNSAQTSGSGNNGSSQVEEASSGSENETIQIGQAHGYKLEEIDHLPPEMIARAGEGDLVALKTDDGRRLCRGGRGSPRPAAVDGPEHG